MSKRGRPNPDEEAELERFMRESEGLGESQEEEYVPLKQRQAVQMSRINERKDMRRTAMEQEDGNEDVGEGHATAALKQEPQSYKEALPAAPVRESKSLLQQAAALRKSKDQLDAKSRKVLEQQQEEQVLLREANKVQTNALLSNTEIATGDRFQQPLQTSWTCPKHIADLPQSVHAETRAKWHIIVEGDDCPPPVKSFKEMKIPQCIIQQLATKNIIRPTPIQVQALPALFSGRDVIGIAFTGSGKTLTFSLPMIMYSLEEEMNMPLVAGEGPIGLVLCPSRELARQTYENLEYLLSAFANAPAIAAGGEGGGKGVGGKYPEIRSTLIVGGEEKNMQTETYRNRGVHCLVATPGRLNDLLNKNQLSLDICKYMVLDEGDRMLDMGFDEEVQHIINRFKRQRQTVLFSATMPKKFQDFAQKTLLRPLLVNVGRAGAANMDVIQEVEFVKKEAKVVYLLECLQKTAPPVVIFCERKGDVDEIHEYLLVKGVDAVSIHGGKDQAERNEAIRLYKEGKKDVLVATDIAAKGLDFPDIQHVINFDMPTEIENYVHRIGRTGRSGKTGVATTFINKEVPESALLDLKHLLVEAKQRVPPVLQALEDPDIDLAGMGGTQGCAFCGGLGHRITECPKLEKTASRLAGGKKDSLAGADGY